MNRFQVSPIGRYWLLMALLLQLIGWLRAINIVLLLAHALLAFWVLNFFLAGRGLRRLRVRRRLEEPIFARTPFTVAVEATNCGRRDLVGVRLAPGASDGPGFESAFLLRLARGETARFTSERALPRRGKVRWPALRGWCGYPFGLVNRSVELIPAEDRTALPRLGKLHRGRLRRFLSHDASLADGPRPQRRPAAAAQAQFHGLRPFRTGDSFRNIHWRTSARRGEWMVREFENATTENLVLVLDPRTVQNTKPKAQSHMDDPGLEDMVSLAATICWEWCRQRGDRFTLAVGGARPVVLEGVTGPEHARRMLECLALVEGFREDNVAPLADVLAASNLPPGPVLVLGGRAAELAPVLAARLHRGAVWLDPGTLASADFYEKPGPDAA